MWNAMKTVSSSDSKQIGTRSKIDQSKGVFEPVTVYSPAMGPYNRIFKYYRIKYETKDTFKLSAQTFQMNIQRQKIIRRLVSCFQSS